MKSSSKLVLGALLLACLLSSSLIHAEEPAKPSASTGKISLSVHSFLPHLGGTARLYVFDTKKTFNKFPKALKKIDVPIKTMKLMEKKTKDGEKQSQWYVELKDMKPGTYAVSIVHDENNDGKMNQVMGIGPPKEGVGCSNSTGGMPKWKESKFKLESGENKKLSIKVVYLFD
jgi:uncharacterized protein (DUF2141 family)